MESEYGQWFLSNYHCASLFLFLLPGSSSLPDHALLLKDSEGSEREAGVDSEAFDDALEAFSRAAASNQHHRGAAAATSALVVGVQLQPSVVGETVEAVVQQLEALLEAEAVEASSSDVKSARRHVIAPALVKGHDLSLVSAFSLARSLPSPAPDDAACLDWPQLLGGQAEAPGSPAARANLNGVHSSTGGFHNSHYSRCRGLAVDTPPARSRLRAASQDLDGLSWTASTRAANPPFTATTLPENTLTPPSTLPGRTPSSSKSPPRFPSKLPHAYQPSSSGHSRRLTASGALADIDTCLASGLERFFGDEGNWKQVMLEVLRNGEVDSSAEPPALKILRPKPCSFTVQVPKPYPGVQYRKSKSVDDRCPRYAQNGTVVVGLVEDNGDWLRVISDRTGRAAFLPMRVGNVQIIIPLQVATAQESVGKGAEPSAPQRSFWVCCSAVSERVEDSPDNCLPLAVRSLHAFGGPPDAEQLEEDADRTPMGGGLPASQLDLGEIELGDPQMNDPSIPWGTPVRL